MEMGLAVEQDLQEARRLYALGEPSWSFNAGQAADDYVNLVCGFEPPSNGRVRRYMVNFARRDWMKFQGAEAPVRLLERIDIMRVGEVWRVWRYYEQLPSRHTDKTPGWDVEDALAWFEENGWTVHSYGATWFRGWPGAPTPVRTAAKLQRDRRRLEAERLYVPEDFRLAKGQINLLYDL